MEEPRRAAPATPEMVRLRPRVMLWCVLAIVTLLTNMTFPGHLPLALVTAATTAHACWLIFRYIRLQIPNDLAFWTPERIRAWDAGERDMTVIAAIVPPADLPPALPDAPRQLPPLDTAGLLPPDRPLRRRREQMP